MIIHNLVSLCTEKQSVCLNIGTRCLDLVTAAALLVIGSLGTGVAFSLPLPLASGLIGGGVIYVIALITSSLAAFKRGCTS